MISPQFVYVIHQEKVNELERKIELARNARERRARESAGLAVHKETWYARAAQWLKAKLLHRAPVSQPERFDKPCPEIPC